jgi:hypothetical protein
LALILILATSVRGDEPPKPSPRAWTLDEALEQLGLHPNDAYLQYVAMQLGKRAGRENEVFNLLDRLGRDAFGGVGDRESRADLFATFTGALALQEGLQLDTMRGERPGRRFAPGARVQPPGELRPEPKKPPEKVSVAKIAGATVKSHPWEKMLGGKKPDVGPLATCVPDDFWFAEFRSLAKLRGITETSELWGKHLFTLALGEARAQATAERIKKQLGLLHLPPEALDAIPVDAVALTGSDLFLGEGSDVTLLVQSRQVQGLQRLIDGLRGTDRTEQGEHAGIRYTHRRSADGSLSVFVAYARDDLHVRSNSLPAFKRVLECIAGKSARRLGDTAEFKYIRTLLPRGAAEEDGFVYLSDPFIRYMVGPQLKLTERRRVLVYNHLRMIGHAALLFRTEHGRAPKSLEELAEAKCAPGVFGQGELAHPDGGTYALSNDGMAGVCSKYGRVESLSPCIEHLVTEVSGDEAEEYKQFLPGYEEYWRTYFDPIVVRVQASAKQYRLETLVLPLLENSVYTTMAAVLGGKPAALDALPTARREIGGLWVHFEKKHLLEVLGPERVAEAGPKRAKNITAVENELKQIALAMHNFEATYQHFPPAAIVDKDGKPLLSWRVAILPFLEQQPLYQQFKLDEPWDSEHNKKLIVQMPAIYGTGNPKLNAEGKTTYVVPVGKDTMFPGAGASVKVAEVTDGLSLTIMAAEANEENAVVWTKPDDLPFDPKNPLAGLARPGQSHFLAAMGDGSTRRISTKLDAETLRRAFIRNDGLRVELDDRKPKAEAAAPKNVVNDLKQIALAMHNYHSTLNQLPPAAISGQDGKPLLSWRVAILRFIEQEDASNLYKQFHLDEPWDSEHNKKLIEKMPRLFEGPNAQLNEQGKTTYVVPVGKPGKYEPIFGSDRKPRTLAQISAADGTANTILAAVADDDHAVTWTKPDDLNFDPEHPAAGLAKVQNQFFVVMADGAVRVFPATIEPMKFAASFGWNDGEIPESGREAQAMPAQFGGQPGGLLRGLGLSVRDLEPLEAAGLDLNKLRRFVRDGIGDQIGFQVYDSSDFLDFSSAGLFNTPGGVFVGGGVFGWAALGPIIQFVTSPATIAIPVKDAAAVDDFLAALDELMAKMRSSADFALARPFVEYYKAPLAGPSPVRVLAISIGGVKARLFIARVGDGLYLANRPTLLQEIAAAHAEGRRPRPAAGHALVRVRPEGWNEVLTTNRLGWAERNRKACVENLSLVANVARGWDTRGGEPDTQLMDRVFRVYGARPFCPDSGRYLLADDGKSCRCSVHGTARDPRQPIAPADSSATAKTMRTFAGLSATLTFEPEGLRAVVIVERKE